MDHHVRYHYKAIENLDDITDKDAERALMEKLLKLLKLNCPNSNVVEFLGQINKSSVMDVIKEIQLNSSVSIPDY